MGGLSGDAVKILVPVIEVIGALLTVLVVLVGGLWRGFRWLDGRIDERFKGLSRSDEFKAMVSKIVAEAATGWADINNRLHEEHRRGISELRKRDDERADAIKRLHGRVDSVWERIGGGP